MPKIIDLAEIKQTIDLVDKLGFNKAADKLGKSYGAVYAIYKKYKSENKIDNIAKAPFVVQDLSLIHI